MDKIQIEILLDGTIKSSTDPVSPANHSSAEAFLTQMAKQAGGKTERRRRGAAEETHTHTTGETHTH